MKVFFTNAKGFRLLVKQTLNRALKYLHQPSSLLECSFSIVDEQQIQQLNKQYRNVDSVTDVLSFPSCEINKQIIDVDNFDYSAINPSTGKLNLGDIIVCIDRAREQAVSYGHSLKREVSFLALHSLLHLLGYDHVDSADEQQMIAIQKAVMHKMKLDR